MEEWPEHNKEHEQALKRAEAEIRSKIDQGYKYAVVHPDEAIEWSKVGIGINAIAIRPEDPELREIVAQEMSKERQKGIN